MRNLLTLLQEYRPGENPERSFCEKILGWMRCEYSIKGNSADGISDLASLWHYVVNHPVAGIHLKLEGLWVHVTVKTFWNNALSHLPSLVESNSKGEGIQVTGHQVYGVGWSDTKSSLHSWLEWRNGTVFCDNDGFRDLCNELGVRYTMEEGDD